MAGIYIHIPFCATRCIYCDFYSTTLRNKGLQFVEALVREMEERKDYLHEPIRTLYLGGGTPSQLGEECINRIIDEVKVHFDLSQCEEITMEGNPEDFMDENLWPLNSIGKSFTRVSLGVQSMNDNELALLHRRHDAQHVVVAVSRLRSAGLRNLSLDLMYGLPTQDLVSWNCSITKLLSLKPEHISAYNLSVEEGTKLSRMVERHELTPCDDETCLQMAAILRQRLKEAGYQQYEISNYALPGYHSRHNSSYWNHTPYLGLGPGAHSFDGVRRRSWNKPFLQKYLKGTREEGFEILSDTELYNETVMLGLRTSQGVPLSVFPDSVKDILSSLIERKLVHIKNAEEAQHNFMTDIKNLPTSQNETQGEYLCLTEQGLALADEVIRELIILSQE